MMKKYFICSDIHGHYTEWQDALKDAGFEITNPDHHIILCGDLLDRGREPVRCLQFVVDLLDKNRIVCVRGNHESLLNQCIAKKEFEYHDYSNGTFQTCVDLIGNNVQLNSHFEQKLLKLVSELPLWSKYEKNCIDYFETANHIFVHSWIPITYSKDTAPWSIKISNCEWYENWRNATFDEWEKARWGNPFTLAFNGFNRTGKYIVFGHWHTSWVRSKYEGCSEWNEPGNEADFSIYKNDDVKIIGLDACTAYSHKVNVLVLTEDEM